jgi:hypothetical protein
MRNAIGCAIACGAFLVGPLFVGSGAAHADLLGVGGGGGGVDVLGIDVLGTGKTKQSGGASVSAARVRGVSTAPSVRSVIVRSKPPAAQHIQSQESVTGTPAALAVPVQEAVAVLSPPAAPAVPLASPGVVPKPAAPAVIAPAPRAALVTPTYEPRPTQRFGPGGRVAPPTRVNESFRAGSPERLRSATTSELIAEALPGVMGLVGFTIIGAFAGYRQAKALQAALLAPAPTSILL